MLRVIASAVIRCTHKIASGVEGSHTSELNKIMENNK